MEGRSKIKILTWNVNGVRMHKRELSPMLSTVRPNVVVLYETRADVRQTFARIWPRAKAGQVLPRTRGGKPAIPGVAVVTEPEGEV